MKWLTMGLNSVLLGGLTMVTLIASGTAASGPALGAWGGDHLQLTIDANGARIELDCASGAIASEITLNDRGTFAATGTFEQHKGGPQRSDEPAAPVKARYTGKITDGVLTLSILPEGANAPQVFTLRKGVRVKLLRCL